MSTIIGLFVVGYMLMIWCVCQLLASGTRQLEIDYPFTEPPARLGHDAHSSTEGHDDEASNHEV